jgi:hypothetical protein
MIRHNTMLRYPMANQRPAHRKGTTDRDYLRSQAQTVRGTICARCGNTKGPIVRDYRCNHPTHQHLPGCPTYRLAPTLGHKTDLQHGGSVKARSNHQLEHVTCNSSAGAKSRTKRAGKTDRTSWDW